MYQQQQQPSQAKDMTRRQFMRDSAVAAAGVALGMRGARAREAQTGGSRPAAAAGRDIEKTRSYNSNMEYRRLGKTGLWISAVSLGGHWKRLPYKFGADQFKQNRRDVVSACIDHGINYVDACAGGEVEAYADALRGRREAMYLGCSYCEHEMRNQKWQTTAKLLEALDDVLTRAKLDYVDLWRITCYWKPGTNHTLDHEQAIIEALEKARKAGKVRFTGISTHKHDWVIRMMETYPETIQVVVVPYTAGSKKAHSRVDPSRDPTGWQAVPDDAATYDKSMVSVIDAVKKNNVGWLGIKPFASGSIFEARGAVNAATSKVDDERARMTLRYILCNDALTAPIPGMITIDQVKNAALAVTERRKFDVAEARRFEQAVERMWANLPADYKWLRREWEWV
ncbi:MAG TPA: aldo/keto reductase [Sedimentisphaerales bacterium]|nr:aldo/keto reductase [Sedimentisphaerales bacterium]